MQNDPDTYNEPGVRKSEVRAAAFMHLSSRDHGRPAAWPRYRYRLRAALLPLPPGSSRLVRDAMPPGDLSREELIELVGRIDGRA